MTSQIADKLDGVITLTSSISKAGKQNKVYIGKWHQAPANAIIHTSPKGLQYYIPSESGPKSSQTDTGTTTPTNPQKQLTALLDAYSTHDPHGPQSITYSGKYTGKYPLLSQFNALLAAHDLPTLSHPSDMPDQAVAMVNAWAKVKSAIPATTPPPTPPAHGIVPGDQFLWNDNPKPFTVTGVDPDGSVHYKHPDGAPGSYTVPPDQMAQHAKKAPTPTPTTQTPTPTPPLSTPAPSTPTTTTHANPAVAQLLQHYDDPSQTKISTIKWLLGHDPSHHAPPHLFTDAYTQMAHELHLVPKTPTDLGLADAKAVIEYFGHPSHPAPPPQITTPPLSSLNTKAGPVHIGDTLTDSFGDTYTVTDFVHDQDTGTLDVQLQVDTGHTYLYDPDELNWPIQHTHDHTAAPITPTSYDAVSTPIGHVVPGDTLNTTHLGQVTVTGSVGDVVQLTAADGHATSVHKDSITTANGWSKAVQPQAAPTTLQSIHTGHWGTVHVGDKFVSPETDTTYTVNSISPSGRFETTDSDGNSPGPLSEYDIGKEWELEPGPAHYAPPTSSTSSTSPSVPAPTPAPFANQIFTTPDGILLKPDGTPWQKADIPPDQLDDFLDAVGSATPVSGPEDIPAHPSTTQTAPATPQPIPANAYSSSQADAAAILSSYFSPEAFLSDIYTPFAHATSAPAPTSSAMLTPDAILAAHNWAIDHPDQIATPQQTTKGPFAGHTQDAFNSNKALLKTAYNYMAGALNIPPAQTQTDLPPSATNDVLKYFEYGVPPAGATLPTSAPTHPAHIPTIPTPGASVYGAPYIGAHTLKQDAQGNTDYASSSLPDLHSYLDKFTSLHDSTTQVIHSILAQHPDGDWFDDPTSAKELAKATAVRHIAKAEAARLTDLIAQREATAQKFANLASAYHAALSTPAPPPTPQLLTDTRAKVFGAGGDPHTAAGKVAGGFAARLTHIPVSQLKSAISHLHSYDGNDHQTFAHSVAQYFTNNWNGASDTPGALLVQDAVARAFGIPTHAPWVHEHTTPGKNDPTLQAIADAYVAAVYEETQKQLAKSGASHVFVMRGHGWHNKQHAPLHVQQQLDAHPAATLVASADILQNPLSSTSSDPAIAKSFAKHSYPYMVVASVPIEQVFSTSHTGLGTGYESEFVVIGDCKNAAVIFSAAGKYGFPTTDDQVFNQLAKLGS